MRRKTKYNNKKVIVDGIEFDSKTESDFYLHLKELKEKGEIKDFELQPPFTLQEGFRYKGRWIHPIKYIADFRVVNNDGTTYVVDIKGMETADFKIKKKIYMKKFPEELKLITFSKIDGGWIELEDLKKARKARKAKKQAKRGEN